MLIRPVSRIKMLTLFILLAVQFFSYHHANAQKAARFNSTGDYIEAPLDTSLAPSQLTVEFWIKVDDTPPGDQQTVLDKRGGSAPGYIVYLMGDQFPLRLYATLNPIDLTISRRIYPNMWYHIAITQDSDSAKSYFNGQLMMSAGNEYTRDFLIPRQPPMLNHYSSRDSMVIRQHLDWMKTYSIDFLVSSWWGQNTGEDVTLRDFILPVIKNSDIKFTIYYQLAMTNFVDLSI